MEPLLYLVHRIPFPPNKGDKVRSFNLLRVLATRFRVHLGTFVDDPADAPHVADVARYCASCHVGTLHPRLARLRSLPALLGREPLSVRYYRDAAFGAWVDAVVQREGIRKAVAFSSSMAQYVAGRPGVRTVLDFVDVDSAKWGHYAQTRGWPAAWLYAREARTLESFERRAAASVAASVFVTPAEAELFRRIAPECAASIHAVGNGVDSAYFDPSRAHPSPFADGEEAVVLTGAMDYWPNVDGACWFAREVLPQLAQARPAVRFYVVGMNPAPAVRDLVRDPRVAVTGRVADIRPWLAHARVVVAPLRMARGIQNKVLEALAMARPVVASTAVAAALDPATAAHVAAAESAPDMARAVLGQLARGSVQMPAARAHVLARYDWDRSLARIADLADGRAMSPAAAGATDAEGRAHAVAAG
jgi:sugar transferase (PEP-CTERM/EpsH1 system associated)